ncbi:EamA family transporter [Legionella sp. W05-934-2]|uniref:EamA family transporter n=1 Tax=Legionella sp. W05-934-2 TaxID=1198649 RepID=UPI00346287D1
MSPGGFILLSALLHAAWNTFAKRTSSPYYEVLGIMGFATVFSLFFIPFFPGPLFVSADSFFWALASGFFEGGYVLTLAISLSQSSLGKAYIMMRGSAMILVWAISALFLGETVNLFSMVGIVCVLIGLVLTSYTYQDARSNQLFPFLCGICIAGYHLCYGRSLAHGANPAALFSAALWIGLPGIVLFMNPTQRQLFKEKIKSGWKMTSIGGLISALSFLLFLLGLRHAEAGLALTLRNTSVVFAQIFACLIGERISKNQWVGAIFVAFGASLLYPF